VIDEVAVVALFAARGIDDRVAAPLGRAAVAGAAVVRDLVAVVARLAEIDATVTAHDRDARAVIAPPGLARAIAHRAVREPHAFGDLIGRDAAVGQRGRRTDRSDRARRAVTAIDEMRLDAPRQDEQHEDAHTPLYCVDEAARELTYRLEMRPIAALALALVGCGRLHFDDLSHGSSGDDGGPDSTPCTGSSFGTPRAYPAGMAPWFVAAGDIDGDGRPDVVTLNYITGGTTTILLNTGGGVLAPQAPLPAGDDSEIVELADVDANGSLDLVMTISGQVCVRLNDGHGAFGAPVFLNSGGAGYPDDLALADFDGDGHLDVVAPPLDSQTANVLYGDGHGAFAASPILYDGFPYYTAAADLDGDGRADIVTGITSPSEIEILMATAVRGTFTATRNATSGGVLVLGDLDRDGHPDIVEALANGDANILRGLGGPSFAAPTTTAVASAIPSSVSVVDIDGDGVLDIVYTRETDNMFFIARGHGDATFAAPVAYPVPGPDDVAFADFDGDGHVDIAFADRGQSSVQIVLQTCTP
jgi:hypothetical protein